MSGKNVNFDNKKIKKRDFYNYKKVAKIDGIDVNKILVPKGEPYGTKNSFKYFIGYNDNDVIRPLCINLLQMTSYVRKFEGIRQCLLRLLISNYQKSIIKYGKELRNYWK